MILKTTFYFISLLAALLVLAYFASVNFFSVNLPILDDFNFLYDILRIEDHASIHRKAFSIIAQHNEHRIAFSRIIALSQLHLTGHIDFRALVFIGNLGLLATLVFLAWGGQNHGEKFWYSLLLAVPVLLSPFQSYQMYSWAMPAISNFWSVAFSIGALACLNWQGRFSIYFASMLAFTAVFTSGQGLVLLPVALMSLLYFRRWRDSIIWGGMCFAVWILYFKLHHIRVGNEPIDDFVKASGWFLVLVGQAPAEAILLFIPDSLLGNPESFIVFRGIVGVGTCLFAAFLILQKNFRSNYFLLSATIYGFALCAAAALSRSMLPYTYALSSQYRNWSLVILALLVLGFLQSAVSQTRRSFAFAGLFLLFFVVNMGFWVSELQFMNAFMQYRESLRESFLSTGELYGKSIKEKFDEEIESQTSEMIQKFRATAKPIDMLQQHLRPENERQYKERILWRAHLYDVLHLVEFRFDEGIFFDRDKLQKIVGELNGGTSQPLNNAKQVLGLRAENGFFRILPLARSEFPRNEDGFIYIRDKQAMKNVGGWEVLRNPELFLKNPAFSPGERLVVGFNERGSQ
jgi:hypothetical protein